MKNYEVKYGGETFILTEDELMSDEVQKNLPEDIEWKEITSSGSEQKNKPAEGKSIRGMYTPFTSKEGNIKPSDFKTYRFSVYDPKTGKEKLVEFSGESEEDAYKQAVSSGAIRAGMTSQERRDAVTSAAIKQGLPTDVARYSADLIPYYTEAQMNFEPPKEKLKALGKDLVTLPVRGLSSAIDAWKWRYLDGEEPDVGRTSEESESQGKTIESIMTSPATGAALLTAPLAEAVGPSLGGLYATSRGLKGIEAIDAASKAAPWASSAVEGASSVGAGYALDKNYGGNNAVKDIAVSMATPSLKPVIGKLSKSAAISRIKSLFKKSGEVLDDESAEIAYNIIAREGTYGSAEQVQKNALEKLAAQQSPADYSNIINDKVDLVNDMTVPEGSEYADQIESFKSYMKNLYGKGDKNVVQYGIDDLYNQGSIDIDTYKKYMSRLDEFSKDQKDIYTRYMDGKMPRDVYNKRMVDLYMKNEDIPGFSEQFQDIFSNNSEMLMNVDPKGFESAKNELLAAKEGMTDDEFQIAQENLLDKWFSGREMSDMDFDRTVKEAKLGGAINKGVLTGGSKFDIEHPVAGVLKKAKGVVTEPSNIVRGGKIVGETMKFAPVAIRSLYAPSKPEQQYDENGNIIYAPKGNVTMEWLDKESEKVKNKAKSLKNLYE